MFNGIPLNDQQKQELNSVVSGLPSIVELRENDALVMQKLVGLEKGQDDIEQRLDKGANRMDGIEEKVDNMAKEIDNLKHQMTTQHHELMGAIKDRETERLKTSLGEMIEAKKAQDSRIWDIVKIVIGVFVVAGLGWVGISGK